MSHTPQTETPQKERSFGIRWAPELEKDGFVPISTFFLCNYHRLKPYPLTHGEAMYLVHLMQFKWDAKFPFPSYRLISKQMGVSEKTTRRMAASLEQKGYLQRLARIGQTNQYNVASLMARLIELKKSIDSSREEGTT